MKEKKAFKNIFLNDSSLTDDNGLFEINLMCASFYVQCT